MGGVLMTAVGRGVLRQGFRVLGHGIRAEPAVFALAFGGSVLFGLLTVAGAFVVSMIFDRVVVPALAGGDATAGALAVSAVAVVALSLLKVIGIFGRRLGAGSMQFRLQARYRRKVTRRYL